MQVLRKLEKKQESKYWNQWARGKTVHPLPYQRPHSGETAWVHGHYRITTPKHGGDPW